MGEAWKKGGPERAAYIKLNLRNLRTVLSSWRERITSFFCQSLGGGGEGCQHLVVDTLLNEDAGSGGTDLAHVEAAGKLSV